MKSMGKRAKTTFESEIAVFVNTYKQLVKDVQDLNHFARIQYPDEKKTIDAKIRDRPRFSDFDN